MRARAHLVGGQVPSDEAIADIGGRPPLAMPTSASKVVATREAVAASLPTQRVAESIGATTVGNNTTTLVGGRSEVTGDEAVGPRDHYPDKTDDAADTVLPDSIKGYIARHGVPLLKAEEEVRLAKFIEAGLAAENSLLDAEERGTVLDPQFEADLREIQRQGEASKEYFIRANLRMVAKIARGYPPLGSMDFWDHFQEGIIGLNRAIEKFDYTRGVKFSTHGDWWIREAITKARAWQARLIRLPKDTVLAQINALVRARRDLQQELAHEPTPQEIAVRMGIDPYNVEELLQYERGPVSLNAPIAHSLDDGRELGGFVTDADAADIVDVTALSLVGQGMDKVLLKYLTEDEVLLVSLRLGFVDGRSYSADECAIALGCSLRTVGRRWGIILKKLREPDTEDAIRKALQY